MKERCSLSILERQREAALMGRVHTCRMLYELLKKDSKKALEIAVDPATSDGPLSFHKSHRAGAAALQALENYRIALKAFADSVMSANPLRKAQTRLPERVTVAHAA